MKNRSQLFAEVIPAVITDHKKDGDNFVQDLFYVVGPDGALFICEVMMRLTLKNLTYPFGKIGTNISCGTICLKEACV